MTDSDLVPLVHATSGAFEGSLHALLHRDRHAAREVLRASAARRLLVLTSEEAVWGASALPSHAVADRLQLVSDIGRIGQLADEIARRALVEPDRHHLSPTARLEVAALLDAGGTRLRQLSDGRSIGVSPAHRRSGSALLEVARRASHDPSATMRVCAGLAIVLLQASRHAVRAA